MAKTGEEQRDQLFEIGLGDGLIETDDETRVAETTAAEKLEKEKKPAEPVAGDGFTLHEDGSMEIDEHLQATIDAAPKGTGEDGQAFIEKTDEKDTGKAPSKGGSSDSSSSSPFLAFAKDRASEGVFLEFNDEDWKELVDRNDGDESQALRELSTVSVQQMVKQGVENFKESITDEERTLYEAKEKGLPLDEYSIAKRNFDKYSKINDADFEDNEKLQEDVVAKSLELRGFSDEDVKEEIEGYKALENLEAKAKKALKLIPDFYKNRVSNIENNAQQQEQSRQDGIRQRVARMKKLVDTQPEIIPGIKLTKPTREKIMKSMTLPTAKDKDGNPLNPVMATRTKNPEAFEMMIHYYHQLGLFNIDDDGSINPDFSKIAKVEKTKATDELRNVFETTDRPVAGKARIPEQQVDELDEFDKAFGRL
jgi:hypothetical protein